MTMPEEVFPEYFLLLVNRFNEVAKTPIEEWMEYLKDAVIREDTQTPGLQAAREKLAIMSMTEKEFREYRDYMVSVHAAKDNWDTMRDEARAEGLAEGLAEGMEKGILSVARKLKSMGLNVADIVKATGLTEDEIHSL
jgi:predicted transposase/invertase (TIGR01784 family)